MKNEIATSLIILVFSSFAFAQESQFESHQKMILEIQREYRDFLTEIRIKPPEMGSDPIPNELVFVADVNILRETDESIPDIYPVEGVPRITSPYGYRDNPVGKGREFHGGVDIGIPNDTDVKCTAKGIVTEVSYNITGGRYLVIDHENGYKSYYGHLSSYLVKLGDSVKKGQVIAKSGETGKVTGPHLHYAIYSGEKTINPLSIIQ